MWLKLDLSGIKLSMQIRNYRKVSDDDWDSVWCKTDFAFVSDEWLNYRKDNDEVFVLTKSFGRALIYADVVVRVDWSYRLAMHVDTDEANAFSNEKEPYGVIVKFFDDNYNTDKWIEDVLSGINR